MRGETERAMNFIELLKALLREERGYSAEESERIVKAHPNVVIRGIAGGNFTLRATAMALEMADAHDYQDQNMESKNDP